MTDQEHQESLMMLMASMLDDVLNHQKKPTKYLLGPLQHSIYRSAMDRIVYAAHGPNCHPSLTGNYTFMDLPVRQMRHDGVAVVYS